MEAPVRPLPEPPEASTASTGDVAPVAGPSGRRVLLGVAIALALLIGGLAVGRRVLHPDHVTRTDYRQVVDGLGDGWRAVAAKDEGVDTGPPFPGAYTILLGTHDDPSAAAMELAWRTDDVAPTYDNLAASTGMQPLPTRRAASCAPQRDGTTLCYAAERGRGLQLRANGVSLGEIATVVDAVSFPDGHPTVDPTALPGDLDVLVDGRNAGLGLVANGNADHPSVASVLYFGPARSSALLVVGDVARQELAYSGVFTTWEPVTDGGRDYFVSTGGNGSAVLWFDDAHAFWLRTSADDVPGILRLAATVRPATEREWKAIPARPHWDEPPLLPS